MTTFSLIVYLIKHVGQDSFVWGENDHSFATRWVAKENDVKEMNLIGNSNHMHVLIYIQHHN